MDILSAIDQIESTLFSMETAVGEPIFNEWALVERTGSHWEFIEYGGYRLEEFLASFDEDIRSMRQTIDPDNLVLGDYAFTHEGHGTGFDAYICVADNTLLLFNHLEKNTSEITTNPAWKTAQIHFIKLLESFLADPLETRKTTA
jgi:hypothetical protein